MADGFIYAISNSAGAVKVGWSKNPIRRVAAVQIGSLSKCVLVGKAPGSKAEERAIHDRFASYRIYGEWFRHEGAVSEFVDALEPAAARQNCRFGIDQNVFDLHEALASQRGMKTRLAHHFGVYPSALSQWDRVPAERVLDVERITGISRHDLRPDIYGVAPEPANG